MTTISHPLANSHCPIRYEVNAVCQGERQSFGVTMPYHLPLNKCIERLLRRTTGQRWIVIEKKQLP